MCCEQNIQIFSFSTLSFVCLSRPILQMQKRPWLWDRDYMRIAGGEHMNTCASSKLKILFLTQSTRLASFHSDTLLLLSRIWWCWDHSNHKMCSTLSCKMGRHQYTHWELGKIIAQVYCMQTSSVCQPCMEAREEVRDLWTLPSVAFKSVNSSVTWKKLKQKALKYLSMICLPMTERWWLFPAPPVNPKNARPEAELWKGFPSIAGCTIAHFPSLSVHHSMQSANRRSLCRVLQMGHWGPGQ